MSKKITNVGVNSLADGAAYTGYNPGGSSGCTMEQIYSPVIIRNGGDPSGAGFGFFETPEEDSDSSGSFGKDHVGPTREELDPYFSNITGNKNQFFEEVDYQAVCNDGPEQDLTLDKTTKSSVSTVCPIAFRGPIMLTGWGYDLADRPVPAGGSNPFDPDNQLVKDRSLWKSGPVDLKWDKERKVWSGGPHIVEGYATGSIPAPTSPCDPVTFPITLFRQYDGADGFKKSDPAETITVTNRDPSLEQENFEGMVYVMAIRINYEWRPLWVGCPEEEAAETPSCIGGDDEE